MIDITTIGPGELVTAIGGLGLAASGLVDTTKVGKRGGISNAGFDHIEAMWRRVIGPHGGDEAPAVIKAARDTLHANWINGMPLTDQRAIAKSLVKLSLTKDSAPHFAQLTGTAAADLADAADRIAQGKSLGDTDAQASARLATAFGRFDFVITALIDSAYQRADQQYRNRSKAWAALVAVVLAEVGGAFVQAPTATSVALWGLCGIVAVPLAPISKDLASALTAGVKVAQTLRR